MKNYIKFLLAKMFTKKAIVMANEKIGEDFHLLTIKISEKKEWIPGDKIQFKINSNSMRSYTPVHFHHDRKTFTTLVFNHQNGPAANLLSKIKPTTLIETLGPRRSLQIDPQLPYIFFGDETSLGLGIALFNFNPNIKLFVELKNLNNIKELCQKFNLPSAVFLNPRLEFIKEMAINPNLTFILSGNKKTILGLNDKCLEMGIDQNKIIKKVYWGYKD